MGFIRRKYPFSVWHFWTSRDLKIYLLNEENVCFSEMLFIGKMYFECISKKTTEF